MTTAFPGLAQIGQINVRVHDLQRATIFYRQALGMKFLFEVPRMAFFDCAGVRLVLALPEGEGSDHPSSVLYFKVDDLQAATSALRARSVRITAEPHLIAKMPDHDLWMSFFEDSEGNTLALMSEVRAG
ncbi:MAG TPA: VOC family protein [Anaerolineales bacterium]|nr:VOC family protein [Anaerolineales bacterium]